ncbi:hypothetical protein EDB85DRAFT_1894103 [Lactarius pseudohatsudake]|nr:hypothetical protein EDB85DRAFT_1894103 [Lactarius pseudohatsudake]
MEMRYRAALMHLGLWLFVPTLFIDAWTALGALTPPRVSWRSFSRPNIGSRSRTPRRPHVVTVVRKLVLAEELMTYHVLYYYSTPHHERRSTSWGGEEEGRKSGVLRRSLSLFNFEVDAARWMRHGATGTVLRSAGGVGVFSHPELRRPHKSALID